MRFKPTLSSSFALVLGLISCTAAKKEAERFPSGQNVVFKSETLVGTTKADYDEMMRLASAFHPTDVMISTGRLSYIQSQTRATVIEEQGDTVRVLITDGPRNGFTCWTSKQSVMKVFPLLPT